MEPYEYSAEQMPNSQEEYNSVNSSPVGKKPKKNHNKQLKLTLLIIAVAIVAGVLGAVLSGMLGNLSSKEDIQPVIAEQDVSENEAYSLEKIPQTLPSREGKKDLTPSEVYSQNVNAVVGIRTTGTTNIWGQVTQTSASGSGFVLTKEGYIVTNCHVIENADSIIIAFFNGDEYQAKVIGADSVNDVALLKIEAENIQSVTVGSSDELIVGEEVIAIGNPLGELTFTMTQGYISALDREINTNGTPINMLQTDAAINSGNSGGPLFDMNGNVIAVTTAKPASSAANGTTVEGIGFAIPIDDVLRIVYELQENGKVSNRAYLGITVEDLDADTAKIYGLPLGVYVQSVSEGSCSEKAGLVSGDIILKINDDAVENRTDLTAKLNRLRAGDTVTLHVYRAGAEEDLTVILDEKPEQLPAEEPQEEQNDSDYYYYPGPEDFFPFFNFG